MNYLRIAEELAQATTNLAKALVAGNPDAVEKTALRVFGLNQALGRDSAPEMTPHAKAKVLAERATKTIEKISDVFANEPVGDLSEGINWTHSSGIPTETYQAVIARADAFDTLCKDATRRRFDMVMAWSVDRLGRSLQDLVAFLSELHALGIDLFLPQQGVDTTTRQARACFR
jgi:hypothetical protein